MVICNLSVSLPICIAPLVTIIGQDIAVGTSRREVSPGYIRLQILFVRTRISGWYLGQYPNRQVLSMDIALMDFSGNFSRPH